MVDYFMLNTRVWVLGSTGDPTLYYYADAAKTITVELYGPNGGTALASTTYNVNAGINTLFLGDWLSAQTGLTEGFHILNVNGVYVTLVIVSAAMSVPTVDQDKIKRIMVIHKASGLMAEIPANSPSIPYASGWMTVVFYHDDARKKGKLYIVDDLNEITTDWMRFAMMKFTLTFPDITTMFGFLSAHSNVGKAGLAEAIGAIANSNVQDATDIVSLYGLNPILGTVVDYRVDVANLKLEYTVAVRLGFGWDDVKKAFKYLAAGAIAAGSVAGGVLLGVKFGPVGAVAGAVLAGAGIGFAYSLIRDSDSSGSKGWIDLVTSTGEQGKQNIRSKATDVKGKIDTYVQNGVIPQAVGDELKADIDTIVQVAESAIDDVVQQAREAYEAGRKAGREEMKKWVVGAGLGGMFVGGMLTRGVPTIVVPRG